MVSANGGTTTSANANLAAPAWRQFQFFSQVQVKDHHAPASGAPEILRQPALISTLHADGDLVLLADLEGNVHQLSPEYDVIRSWQCYGQLSNNGRCTHIRTVAAAPGLIVTLGDEPGSSYPVLKIWHLHLNDLTSSPTLLRSARINPSSRPTPASALAVAPALSQIFVGLADGTVVTFRHVDQLVEATLASATAAARAAADSVDNSNTPVLGLGKLRTIHEGREPITYLGVASTGPGPLTRKTDTLSSSTLFILTTAHILSFPMNTSSSKATTTILDTIGASVGCSEMLKTTEGERMVVAREEAIYVYGADGREGCYAYEGPKSAIRVLTSRISPTPTASNLSTYLAIVSPPVTASVASNSATIRSYARNAAGGSGPAGDVAKVTLFDPENKFVAHSGTFEEGVRDVWEAWGSVWVLTEAGQLYRLSEQPLASSLSTLFSRNLYTLAVSLAQSRKLSQSEVAEIYRRYGDHLYGKSDFEGAMGCYIKTVGVVQASYVIRKFLDAQRLTHLTSYLQELHARGLANSDHTTLLLNCYTKLADDSALSDFIHSSAKRQPIALPTINASGTEESMPHEEPPFDLETAIRVCRQAGYFEHAVWLAERYGQHSEYLRIQIEDRADVGDALAYLRRLEPEAARDGLLRYGNALLRVEPRATTQVLIDLCCGSLQQEPAPPRTGDTRDEKGAGSSKGYLSYLAYGTASEPVASTSSSSPASRLPSVPTTEEKHDRTVDGAHAGRKSGLNGDDFGAETSSSIVEHDLPSPRLFFAHFVDHPDNFITFLESVAARRYGKSIDQVPSATTKGKASARKSPSKEDDDDVQAREEQAVWNTLLELLISHEPDHNSAYSQDALRSKALRLLNLRDSVPYDETQALLVCSTRAFEPGLILLYEKLGMYDEIIRYWIDAAQSVPSNTGYSSKVIQALQSYGNATPYLYRMVLRFLTTSSELLSRHQADIADILDTIEEDKILPPIAVVQILSKNGTASIGLVREYLKKQLTAEKQEIDSDTSLIESYRTETAKKRAEMAELSDPAVPRIFQVTRCSACGGQLDLPAVHFMCRHSYHQRCLGENEQQCPNCARTHGVVRELAKSHAEYARRPELFQGEVTDSEDGFATIASAFAKGLMGLTSANGG